MVDKTKDATDLMEKLKPKTAEKSVGKTTRKISIGAKLCSLYIVQG